MKKDIQDLFASELQDMFNAEQQIVDAFPEMIKAADSPELKDAFKTHLHETKQHVQRLEKILNMLEIQERKKVCKAMKGLIQDCEDVIQSLHQSAVRDASLISKVQRIELFEISAYGTLRAFAKDLDFDDIADMLKVSLDEEKNADKRLTQIAEGGLLTAGINQKAMS